MITSALLILSALVLGIVSGMVFGTLVCKWLDYFAHRIKTRRD